MLIRAVSGTTDRDGTENGDLHLEFIPEEHGHFI
jgi:hypothetical protein